MFSDKKETVKVFLVKLVTYPVIWALLSSGVIIGLSLWLIPQSIDENGAIRASLSTGIAVVAGYFITHYLIKQRELKQKRLEQCLGLVKGLRVLLLEGRYTKPKKGKDTVREKRQELIDRLQDSYYAFSLLATSQSCKLLEDTMSAFSDHLKEQTDESLKKFKGRQREFINRLRKDFFVDKKINFETYDIKWD